MITQQKEITKTLKLFTDITKSCGSEYRILGSILLMAHFNKIFRKIHDIDIVVDKDSYQCVVKKLKDNNFVINEKQWTWLKWIEVTKKAYLPLTFFLVGEFHSNYFSYYMDNNLELRVKSEYLKKTLYKFNDVEFIGTPLTSALAGIYQAFLNPKRKLDKQLLLQELGNKKINVFGNVNLYFANRKIPYAYDTFSFFYNMYGGLRVLFGSKWEAWD